jgi:hypothetical protein
MSTTIDLTGGLEAAQDALLAAPPGDDPDFREGLAFWFTDSEGRFGVPRIALEHIARDWSVPFIEQLNLAFADGRALTGTGAGGAFTNETTEQLARGHTVEFRCLEPFRRWSVSYRGRAIDTTAAAQAAGTVDPADEVDVALDLEATMAAPPWVQGTMGALEVDDAIFIGDVGGLRFEQLFRGEGTLRVGTEEWTTSGQGLRIHRRGARNTTDFRGHVWQSAVFPSGRAFGYIAFAPRADGSPSYSEGYVVEDGRLVPATVVDAPWLRRLDEHQQVPVVLETAAGQTRIEGETVASTFRPFRPGTTTAWTQSPVTFEQGCVRYRWDGEEACNMIERSSLPELVTG